MLLPRHLHPRACVLHEIRVFEPTRQRTVRLLSLSWVGRRCRRVCQTSCCTTRDVAPCVPPLVLLTEFLLHRVALKLKLSRWRVHRGGSHTSTHVRMLCCNFMARKRGYGVPRSIARCQSWCSDTTPLANVWHYLTFPVVLLAFVFVGHVRRWLQPCVCALRSFNVSLDCNTIRRVINIICIRHPL